MLRKQESMFRVEALPIGSTYQHSYFPVVFHTPYQLMHRRRDPQPINHSKVLEITGRLILITIRKKRNFFCITIADLRYLVGCLWCDRPGELQQCQAVVEWNWSLCKWKCQQASSWKQVWSYCKQSCVIWDSQGDSLASYMFIILGTY